MIFASIYQYSLVRFTLSVEKQKCLQLGVQHAVMLARPIHLQPLLATIVANSVNYTKSETAKVFIYTYQCLACPHKVSTVLFAHKVEEPISSFTLNMRDKGVCSQQVFAQTVWPSTHACIVQHDKVKYWFAKETTEFDMHFIDATTRGCQIWIESNPTDLHVQRSNFAAETHSRTSS